jgi:hypothetical protein
MKTLRGLLILSFLFSGIPLFSQSAAVDGKANPIFDSVAVVQRLSYDNFKNIKLLMTAILNFGGGEAEFNKLVDGYAEASSFYFSREYDKAAQAFAKNEKDIKEVAARLAEKYKKDATDLNKEIIKANVNIRVKQSVANKKPTDGMLTAELMLKHSSESISKANDELDRAHPVQAITLYRRSKENSITFYEAMEIKEANGQKLNERFAREKADNMNKLYIAKEKKN